MFEIIKRERWLDRNLASIVRNGLLEGANRHYPSGISEDRTPRNARVATGQQAGFAGGPLYTLLKRWNAESISGSQAASWFWVEAADSDWREIASIEWFGKAVEFEDQQVGVPVGDRLVPADFHDRLQAIRTLPEAARALYAPAMTVREAFRTCQLSICPSEQLNWFDGGLFDDSRSKYLDVVTKLFSDLPGGVQALRTGIERVRAESGSVQAELLAGRTGWFAAESPVSVRYPVIIDGSHFVIHERRYSRHELMRALQNREWIPIPGALWRTVVQQLLIDPQHVVCGAAEAAYWAETCELFAWTGVRFPEIILRSGMTILPASTKALSVSDIYCETDPTIAVSVEWTELKQLRERLQTLQNPALAGFPAHLQDAIRKNFEKIEYQFERTTKLADQYYDELSGSRRKRRELARREIGLEGVAQERRMTGLEAFVRWGSEGMRELQRLISNEPTCGILIVREL